MSRDPVDNVTSTYAALNQLQCKLHKRTGKLSYLSVARLLEYGVRIVHEDTHNHYHVSEKDFDVAHSNLRKMGKENPTIKKALDFLRNLEETYVHLVQSDFADYFLDKLLRSPFPHTMPFYYVQFPPLEETIQMVGDRKTLLYLGDDQNIDFKLVWDEPMLPNQDTMSALAGKAFSDWPLDVNKVRSFDRKGFIRTTSKTLVKIVSLPPEKFNKDAILDIAEKRIKQ